MSALLEALAQLPAGSSELTAEQAAWFKAQLAAAGVAPAGGAGVWKTWDLDLEGAGDERAQARLTLNARGTAGSAFVVRGARHVDERESQLVEVAQPRRPSSIKNNNRAGALALVEQAQALAARKEGRR